MSIQAIPIYLSIVIPVYNAEGTLEELVTRVRGVATRMAVSYEIVLVNDGSRDESWKVMSKLHYLHGDTLLLVDLMRNFGQHNAIMCGLRESSGKFIVTLDDDLQNPPEEIPKLIEAIERGQFDLVYGRPPVKRHRWWRNLGSNMTQLFYKVVFNRRNGVTSFRIVRRELVESILSYSLNFTYLDGLFAWNTERINEIPVEHHARSSGRSGYSLRKLLILSINLFTNFSLVPLQLVSAVGVLVATAGFGAGFYYVFQRLMHNIEVPGFASVMVAVLTLGGVQLLSVGIMGEYLGRVHLNANRKPQYVKREVRRRSSPSVGIDGNAGPEDDDATVRPARLG